MANWTQTKKMPELKGIKCDIEREGDSIKVITLTDEAGSVARIKPGESYCSNLHVFEPARPKMVKRWRLMNVALSSHVSQFWDVTGRVGSNARCSPPDPEALA